ncbi:DUF58 domain-containing protein [Candidatus Laterigemmans baculatus]|uniref:DUF58 domain-containing protein n=1 Tax=Candidatus Laterigemmans baculatus TaxID=2770505 RepID=UPI0013DA6F17|nr:DUF58 domain-containing protein [Candidatus Laterigemmans baculatus]
MSKGRSRADGSTSGRSGDLLQRVHRLRIHCGALVDQQLAGSYASPFKGQGIEFEETRPYQAGDDVRAIDWRVTARSGRPFVKLFREERQSTVYLIIDGSGSVTAPPFGATPWDRICEVAGVLALVASADENRVGLLLFTDRVELAIPPAGGTEHAMRILRDVVAWEPASQPTDLRPPLERLLRTERRRCTAVVLSDFLAAGYERALRIAAASHELIPIVCHHPLQREVPRVGLLPTRDPESGRMLWLDTFSRRQREEYRRAAAAMERRRDELFARLRLPVLHLSSHEDVAVALRRFFDRRGEPR